METSTELNSFYTKEGATSFKIKINCKISFTEANFLELKNKARKLPRDEIIIEEGLAVRYSLDDDQKNIVLELIKGITKSNYQYCEENDLVRLSGHILNDYLSEDPQVLSKRGWDTDEEKLYESIILILCNVISVDKASIRFKTDGDSYSALTYTVYGEHDGYSGMLALNFENVMKPDGSVLDTFLIVTILERKKIIATIL